MKENEILKALWEGRERAVQISVMIILLSLLSDSVNAHTAINTTSRMVPKPYLSFDYRCAFHTL